MERFSTKTKLFQPEDLYTEDTSELEELEVKNRKEKGRWFRSVVVITLA